MSHLPFDPVVAATTIKWFSFLRDLGMLVEPDPHAGEPDETPAT